MADVQKFTVVRVVGQLNQRAHVEPMDPADDAAPALVFAHKTVGVTQTDADSDDPVSILRNGYVRGLTSAHITGWEPSAGALLWCGAGGKPTTTLPTSGPLILVGTYIGNGIADVNVQVFPSIGELSFVKRESPAEYDVLIWSDADGAYVPRQIDHGQDLAGLGDDDHPQYQQRIDMSAYFMFMGAN